MHWVFFSGSPIKRLNNVSHFLMINLFSLKYDCTKCSYGVTKRNHGKIIITAGYVACLLQLVLFSDNGEGTFSWPIQKCSNILLNIGQIQIFDSLALKIFCGLVLLNWWSKMKINFAICLKLSYGSNLQQTISLYGTMIFFFTSPVVGCVIY